MGPPEHHRTIARHVAAAWGGTPRIVEMRAKGTSHVQAIAELTGFPEAGMICFATIGLSDHGGSELSTAVPTSYKSVVKAIFDVASYVAAGGRKLEKNAVFEKALARFYTRADAGHLLARAEAPEAMTIPMLSITRRRVRWLYAWPITSDELVWRAGKGKTALDALLDRAGMAAFDVGRASLKGVPAFDPWAAKPKR